jgi:molybdopterin molybdotransferase
MRERGRLFDAYLAVDWSARSLPSSATPTRDALWVGEATLEAQGPDLRVTTSYWRTRHACIAHVRARLLAHLAAGRRVLVGFDFPYGYPAGYAGALDLGGPAPPWRRIWHALAGLIVDEATYANKRFAEAA